MPALPFAIDDGARDGVEGFSLRFCREAHEVVVEVIGELDGSTAPLLLDPLLDVIEAQGNQSIALDVTRVDFMDSSGLRALLSVHRLLQSRGGTLVVRHPTPLVRRMLEITGVVDVFAVESA